MGNVGDDFSSFAVSSPFLVCVYAVVANCGGDVDDEGVEDACGRVLDDDKFWVAVCR